MSWCIERTRLKPYCVLRPSASSRVKRLDTVTKSRPCPARLRRAYPGIGEHGGVVVVDQSRDHLRDGISQAVKDEGIQNLLRRLLQSQLSPITYNLRLQIDKPSLSRIVRHPVRLAAHHIRGHPGRTLAEIVCISTIEQGDKARATSRASCLLIL